MRSPGFLPNRGLLYFTFRGNIWARQGMRSSRCTAAKTARSSAALDGEGDSICLGVKEVI
jgi:hypothetical protein